MYILSVFVRKRSVKLLLILSLSSLLVFSCSQHPALKVAKPVIDIEEANYIVPYFLNLSLLNELPKKKNYKDTRNYILWVFDNLNYPDKHGMTGTIYDFYITKSGLETPVEKYDSVDSYSASFLMMLNEYTKLSGDKSIVKENSKKILDIVYTLAFLQDSDGLTTAKPNHKEKYLMDNCEVYGGLTAYLELAERYSELEQNQKEYYPRVRKNIKDAINSILFNEINNNFDWAFDGLAHTSDWNVFYPDSYAQLFPILFDITEDADLKQHLWKEYNKRYKNKTLPKEQEIIYSLTKKRMEI